MRANRLPRTRLIAAALATMIGVLIVVPPSGSAAAATARTVVKDRAERDRLVGSRLLSLQWVSWEKFGRADVVDDGGVLRLSGQQQLDGNYVRLKGTIVEVATRQFLFRGLVETRVSYINGGDACLRRGDFLFVRTGTRKYWRMRPIDNPCDEVADYVDVYVARAG